MGLFRKRKDMGFIDIGDDQVAVSPERIEEFAEHVMGRVWVIYERPLAREVSEGMNTAIVKRHSGPHLSEKLGMYLSTLARIGYAVREWEESLDSLPADSPMLTEALQARLDAGDDVVGMIASVCLSLCDYSRDDPASPRSLDAIDGLIPVRDRACEKALEAAVPIAAHMELAQPGKLPPEVDFRELAAVWRIGFLSRTCERSMPDGVEFQEDDQFRLIAVDIPAVEAAGDEWRAAHPDATEEEFANAIWGLLESPNYQLALTEVEEWEKDDTKFRLYHVDPSGRIINPETREPTNPMASQG